MSDLLRSTLDDLYAKAEALPEPTLGLKGSVARIDMLALIGHARTDLRARHDAVCACPFDGTDPDCNFLGRETTAPATGGTSPEPPAETRAGIGGTSLAALVNDETPGGDTDG